MFYCRRPETPITLKRDENSQTCFHNGILHTFDSLLNNNISVRTILFEWKANIDKAEEYFKYQNQLIKLNGSEFHICQCTNPRSFGNNCEYIIPEEELIINNTVQTNQDYMVCYKTLQCNYGLLCLDWRDVCDGVQQCMYGLDENNCDKLEFNECENDEYRCMNGMCIPDEYFLDGEYDCMDMSDEKETYDTSVCPSEPVEFDCDDRLCLIDQWSCGDGQCIDDSYVFMTPGNKQAVSCANQRNQFYACEMNSHKKLWVSADGQCHKAGQYKEPDVTNYNLDDYCTYLLKCNLTYGAEKNCPCGKLKDCSQLLKTNCSSNLRIQYPKGARITPYMFEYYSINFDPLSFRKEIILNGSIKCQQNIVDFLIEDTEFIAYYALRHHETAVCLLEYYNETFSGNEDSYFCNGSNTFNNQSYNFIKLPFCIYSHECISAYRIKDGIFDCLSQMDEKIADNVVLKSCSNVRHHRFRCGQSEPTCLYAHKLGDYKSDCMNDFDESWLGTPLLLSKINCNKQKKDGCVYIRYYIEQSWKSDLDGNITLDYSVIGALPYRSYCDSFWDLFSKEDEDTSKCQQFWICPEEQWRCHTGQCIDIEWVLDGEWDCPDASDEENIYVVNYDSQHHNYRWVKDYSFQIKFNNRYRTKTEPFSMFCNLTIEYPCLPINVSNDLIQTRPCIDLKLLGNDRIDCLGGYDERNKIKHCNQFSPLGYNFKCSSNDICIPNKLHCGKNYRCPTDTDDEIWCKNYPLNNNDTKTTDFKCFNGMMTIESRCDDVDDCPYGEDEYMCDIELSTKDIYRNKKRFFNIINTEKLHLRQFPIIYSNDHSNNTNNINVFDDSLFEKISLRTHWCHRGLSMLLHNKSIICFCPVQYYGDRCQYHSDRITVYFHLNLTNSHYTKSTDTTIVIKLLMLFLYEEEVIDIDEFHVRPALEIDVYDKKRINFHYSRSNISIENKRKRYFNRTDIIHSHPYKIRIEAYEMKLNQNSRRFAVWQYPIYFDYLSVYRFSKVLRFNRIDTNNFDPCSHNICNQNQECYSLNNDPSKHVCLCKEGFTGKNCEYFHPMCNESYCSLSSICRPFYRGILVGNDYPYCVCTLNYVGERCELNHTVCSENPCQNGGTCYRRSRIDGFFCLCTDEYTGNTCQLHKQYIHLYINNTMNIDYEGIVVQYLKIDYNLLKLLLINQNIYSYMPKSIFYRYNEKVAPEFVLIKFYSNDLIDIYIMSLQINTSSIHGNTSITDYNRCIHIDSLFSSKKDVSIFKYHGLCQMNQSLFCFRDQFYICVCDKRNIRAECFIYDYNTDLCSHCLAGGRCLKGNPNEFLCLCPQCHSGRFCQFNFESFSFTIDQLFFPDLSTTDINKRRLAFCLIIILPFCLFVFGLFNNFLCFKTFKRIQCRRNGIGEYLLYMSITNQINLTILMIRIVHLTSNMSVSNSHRTLNTIVCKISYYSLTTTTRIIYWLSSFIAIERIYVVLCLNGRWLKNPNIAKRIILSIVIIMLIMGSYELVFIKSEITNDDGYNELCVLNFPLKQSIWNIFHTIVTILNAAIPFLINLFSTIGIIHRVTRQKLKTNIRTSRSYLTDLTTKYIETRNNNSSINEVANDSPQNSSSNDSDIQQSSATKQNNIHLLIDVIIENKELIVAPVFTLIPQLFSLPYFIISLSLACQDFHGHRLRYLLMVSYFMTFIPQVTSFFLYITPSSFYSKEWQSTKVSKWTQKFTKPND